MLIRKQVEEIKEHLDKAQNPLFFFDNDVDGLCSFILLQKYIGRGKGVPIKPSPLSKNLFRKISELSADYIFILDCPSVEEDFFEEIRKINIPVVWIDHHFIEKDKIPNFISYYNPIFNLDGTFGKEISGEPVTALCYQINERKEDLWIAILGCISDKFVPEFYSNFKKVYPELVEDSENAFDIFYKSQIGKVARILDFSLKDKTTNVIKMLKYLIEARGPYDILEENNKNFFMHKRFEEIDKKYRKLLDKAIAFEKNDDNVLFFQYEGSTSMSSALSNELSYLYPNKVVVVVYAKGSKLNISIRGKSIRNAVQKTIEDLDDATGGGHEDAAGARIRAEDLEKFKDNFLENLK